MSSPQPGCCSAMSSAEPDCSRRVEPSAGLLPATSSAEPGRLRAPAALLEPWPARDLLTWWHVLAESRAPGLPSTAGAALRLLDMVSRAACAGAPCPRRRSLRPPLSIPQDRPRPALPPAAAGGALQGKIRGAPDRFGLDRR